MGRIRLILPQLKSIFANATKGYAGELHDKKVPMIVIDDYHATWPDEFEELKADLGEIFGPMALSIDHIGSTSVPGLAAKDVIDIQVSVASLTPEIVRRLTAAGYRHKADVSHDHVPAGENEHHALWAKLLFAQPEGQRRANIHFRVIGNPNQRYPLLFRGYLRAHPNSARSVAAIKQALAERHADDVEAYYDIKDPVYDLIWEAAQEWVRFNGKEGNDVND